VTEWWRMICGGRNLKLEGKGPFRRWTYERITLRSMLQKQSMGSADWIWLPQDTAQCSVKGNYDKTLYCSCLLCSEGFWACIPFFKVTRRTFPHNKSSRCLFYIFCRYMFRLLLALVLCYRSLLLCMFGKYGRCVFNMCLWVVQTWTNLNLHAKQADQYYTVFDRQHRIYINHGRGRYRKIV
jgi:hypothetical protein